MKNYKIIFIFVLLMLLSTFLHAQGSWHPEKTYWPRTLIDSSQTAIKGQSMSFAYWLPLK
jgi:hypothetical protein